ncbi:hypothetical protein HCN44_010769 [Aphidius gifuensis]|uniref:Uncharacterized protein n=1 Tax=Aphidius gifuensis TaxID=684658 RepID=A0A835CS70_APHGI|nr:uncharacterized protein LOC122855883 [Aphidius gifuensis]KAF7991968.1 hypothetical protein HCN44_010769 [Aphidius gifuensis]
MFLYRGIYILILICFLTEEIVGDFFAHIYWRSSTIRPRLSKIKTVENPDVLIPWEPKNKPNFDSTTIEMPELVPWQPKNKPIFDSTTIKQLELVPWEPKNKPIFDSTITTTITTTVKPD